MITLTALLVFSGFFAGYCASAKAMHAGNSRLETAMKNNPVTARRISVVLLVTALAFAIVWIGAGCGTLLFFIALMVSGSVIVLLSPLKIVTVYSASAVFALLFLIEIANLI